MSSFAQIDDLSGTEQHSDHASVDNGAKSHPGTFEKTLQVVEEYVENYTHSLPKEFVCMCENPNVQRGFYYESQVRIRRPTGEPT